MTPAAPARIRLTRRPEGAPELPRYVTVADIARAAQLPQSTAYRVLHAVAARAGLDLSRVLGEPEADAEWWFAMEDRYADFGGRSFEGYRQLAAERETRLAIEAALRGGEAPTNNGPLDARRFRLVTLQEKRRLAGDAPAFSCSCEGSIALADREDE